MRARKDRRVPALTELPTIFDDGCIAELAKAVGLPPEDIPRFKVAIHETVHRYIVAATIPNNNAIHYEIKALYRAAELRRYIDVAKRISGLSEVARALLKKRGDRPSVALTIPQPDACLDPATRSAACDTIVRLLRVGGRLQEGRRRGGRTPMIFVPELHAPRLQQHPPRRESERDFVMWLQVAYSDVTGKLPTYGADPHRPGPFARMVQICLNRVRSGANAVKMLNELQRRRLLKQLPPPT